MPISSTSRPGVRGKVLTKLPATLQAAGGLAVSKENGVWTFEPDWTVLALETSPAEPTSRQLWIFDPDTETYTRMSLAGFGDALHVATSTTSLAIGTGSKTFITQAGKDFAVGSYVLATSDADPLDYMLGRVTAYAGTSLTMTVITKGGSGTDADWTIRASGPSGGAGTGDMSSGNNLSDVADVPTARSNLGLVIGTNVQAYDAFLLSVATLGTAADKLIYTTGVNTAAEADLTSYARTILDDANAAAALATLTARGQGKETVFIPASAMTSRTTNGPSSGLTELSSNKVMVRTLDFDTTTQEFAQFSVWFPKSWNLGTVTFQPSFSQLTTAAGGVVFGLAGVSVSDGDDLDVAFGTAVTSTKTAGVLNREYQGPESAAITIAGTPTAGDRVVFQINRTVADASDTLAQDARLHGVRLFFTTNAATDT